MKNIYSLIILFACLFFLGACDDDNDSNPTYTQPATFKLNNPGYALIVTDLQKSTSLELSCSQPDYGFTAATTYAVQVSLDNTWNEASEEADATYEELATSSNSAKMNAHAEELSKAIVKLSKWEKEEDFDGNEMEIYLRLKASVSSFLTPLYSNSVKIKVLPYYIELVDALPAPYYLIGSCIGDGAWTNELEGIGSSIIPMALIKDYEYNKVTGKGEFVYVGYFPANQGFKIIGTPGSWDEQWGSSNGEYVHNDGGSGDITVSKDGWYKVTLNSIDDKLTIEAVEMTTPNEFAAMELVGEFDGWGGNPLVMSKTSGEHSHVWYADVTFDTDAAEDGGCKFRTDDTWSNNWGGGFPYSLAGPGGSNIPYKAGEYRVVFDDYNGCYYFVQKPEE